MHVLMLVIFRETCRSADEENTTDKECDVKAVGACVDMQGWRVHALYDILLSTYVADLFACCDVDEEAVSGQGSVSQATTSTLAPGGCL